jgi:hypothetical protein
MCLGREPAQVADTVIRHGGGEGAFRVRAGGDRAAGHGGERGPPARRAAADGEPLAVCLARVGQRPGGGRHVVHVHHAPLPAQALPVGAAVSARPAVVHVDDPDAAAGEIRLLQVEHRVDTRGRPAVHPHHERRQLTVRRGEVPAGRRVDDRVHHLPVRAGQLPGPRPRQEGLVRQRVRLPPDLARDPGAGVYGHYAERRGRPSGQPGHRVAGRRHLRGEHQPRRVQSGQLAGLRIQDPQPGDAGPVHHGEPPVGQRLERPGAQLPQRRGELLLSRAQRSGDAVLSVRQVQVPPAGPVGHRVQAPLVAPHRGEHRFGLLAHEHTVASQVSHGRHPQLSPVPRHPRMIPGHPGELRPVRRRRRERDEVRPADQHLNAVISLGRRPVERHRHDRPADDPIGFAFADTQQFVIRG